MTKNLQLRPFAPDDAAAFHAAVVESVRELVPWMPWCHDNYTIDEATAWVTMQSQAFANRVEFEFVVIDDGVIVGACGLNQLDPRNQRANIGYWMRSSAMNKGYATRAVKQLLEWAKTNTDFHRFEIVVAVDNVASIRVAEKSGAIREGVLRERLLLYDRFHDAVMFAHLRDRR